MAAENDQTLSSRLNDVSIGTVSLDELIERYARKRFKETRKFLKKKKCTVEIKYPDEWKPKYEIKERREKSDSTLNHEATFINNAATEQTYTYDSAIENHWSCQVSYNKGCKMRKKLDVSLILKNVLSVTGSVFEDISLNKDEQRVVGGQSSSKIGGSVTVPRNTCMAANIDIKQKHFSSTFVIKCVMTGAVRVVFKDLKTKECLTFGDYGMKDIVLYAFKKKLATHEQFKIEDGKVESILEGTCQLYINTSHVKINPLPNQSKEVQVSTPPNYQSQETQVNIADFTVNPVISDQI